MKKGRFVVVLVFLGLLYSFSAWAYLDPSSGSVLLQMLIGGIATGALVLKTKWGKVKVFFSGKKELKEE